VKTPRPYQLKAIEEARRHLIDEGRPGTAVVMATGLGKTFTVARLARGWPETWGRRILFCADRTELIRQAYDAFCDEFGPRQVEIEMGEDKATGCKVGDAAPRVVIASKQSICLPGRLRRFRPSNFGLLISDEAHHWAPVNQSYTDILEHFDRAKRLAITATYFRGDGVSLADHFGDEPAFAYGLAEGCADGYLVEPRQEVAPVSDLDFSGVQVNEGDFTEKGLEELLTEEGTLAKLVGPLVETASAGRARRTLVFTPTVYTAQRVAEVINRPGFRPGRAVAVAGVDVDDRRRDGVAGFRDGRYQFLVSCDLFLEGFDEPLIDLVVIARMTKRLGRYIQMVGRGTRPARAIEDALSLTPDAAARRALIARSVKPDLLVLDFGGNAGRHKIPRCADVLFPQEPPEVLERVERNLARKPKDGRTAVSEAVLLARQQLEEEERRRRQGILIRARYSRREVPIFGDATPAAPADAGLPLQVFKLASDKQKAILRRHGNFRDEARLEKMSHRQASAIITKMKKSGKWKPAGGG
jgi:superfamily II DNA or RNA helicase